jgi:hypothetical protein
MYQLMLGSTILPSFTVIHGRHASLILPVDLALVGISIWKNPWQLIATLVGATIFSGFDLIDKSPSHQQCAVQRVSIFAVASQGEGYLAARHWHAPGFKSLSTRAVSVLSDVGFALQGLEEKWEALIDNRPSTEERGVVLLP